ncbi:tRNA (uracil-O(2)-)-methyltransferase [Fulvia fulva]|uniref:tRNA (uracil-O(2)-)-methyltransferase n=1 Tax=Passalora fulva TaxID=5499 RepID=A0A9Q8P3J0_PASFU|nr:tRNA (uracil-O(2)-)-methyltransferase [Fulvia fulva]KAK4634385.1 tRNA (uracil-O(2)-)-methyltransferase [Fulvia fulva]KAK4636785.1 tRNA (uracil-O(2)-)-methyltransferase [Fulvia fulva]UJO11747.1 tRNA (uracil-O(2)-)-methyltransferase [Fulvia fulva]WPV09348.1 tRNA (uracil-O(2)-)-methyltransferase [Fulvia fulva]WPV25126.1 tRNA (uracil-O(2)-)-methyltransferase [Fulvia fulva]
MILTYRTELQPGKNKKGVHISGPKAVHSSDDQITQKKPAFEPRERAKLTPPSSLPDELWLPILQCPCPFPPELFSRVMLNMVKNPNVTSSHLFRADIFYDSDNDQYFDPSTTEYPSNGLAKHLKAEYQPRSAQWPGAQLTRTIVRQLIPRNPQLDRPLVQTCHFFRRLDGGKEDTVVMYVPHVDNADEMPFYHPAVSQIAFTHTWSTHGASISASNEHQGTMTLLYRLYSGTTITTKQERTALKLLQTIHKHGQGQLLGYEKRVHLDRIIPQKRYQDTYSVMKAKYGKMLSEQWVEHTDPGKHVFEDIGIAAFLVELWRDMFEVPMKEFTASEEKAAVSSKPPFPGFVDIGCGNGVLTYILLTEGYHGWGFDARRRKTWETFPASVQDQLKQSILVPNIFITDCDSDHQGVFHDGIFDPEAFIISNHADELTPWTPLLAFLNNSAFIAIPCCSHDLAGARFRAPTTTKAIKKAPTRLPQQVEVPAGDADDEDRPSKHQAAETGSLKRSEAQRKIPSAYSTLCSYVRSLAIELGFLPEEDVLRIPSTRNSCILGRNGTSASAENSEKRDVVKRLIERELKRDIEAIGAQWIENARKLMKKPSSGH